MKKKRQSKRLPSLLLAWLLSIFFISANAGPPLGGRVLQIPFHMYCHPSAALMIESVMKSFGQHIAAIFAPRPELLIYVMWNEEEKTISVLGERNNETCLILSGGDARWFDRPDVMPSRDNKSEDIGA